MNNYNNNNEHESIEISVYRDFDYFNYEDYYYVYDKNNTYNGGNNILKHFYIQNPLDKRKLLKEKKSILIELADFIINYYIDFEDYTKEQLADFIIENILGTTADTRCLIRDFKIEKYFFDDYKLYTIYGYCQGELTYFIGGKNENEEQLQNMLYNAPIFLHITIDDEQYFTDDIDDIDDLCYDIDELKEKTIKFLKEKNYSQYVIDFVNNNFNEDNY